VLKCSCLDNDDADHRVMTKTHNRRHYDHRLRRLVSETGNIQLAVGNGVPHSTARDWSRSSSPDVVSLDVVSMSEHALQREVLELRQQNARLTAILRLVVVLLKVFGATLSRRRLADGAKKQLILHAVERSRSVLLLRSALPILGLSSTRYHSWKREEECELDDVSSCPRTFPHQLTSEEIVAVKEMVTAEEYRHLPTGTLALLAQRLGKVFASPSTWYRLVRLHRWRRPRKRVHPPKPKLGIRASKPEEIWHIDTSVIRLLDGTRAYLYAVIDNFSRRILAWRVSEQFNPGNTVAILLDATHTGTESNAPPTLLADQGVENVNARVDELIESGALRRVLAQTEIACSNSMIESWWRSLKHQWLYLNTLDTAASVRRLVAYYVSEHNTQLPHSAFRGQTPDEMYFATGHGVPEALAAERKTARAARLEANRSTSCRTCEPERYAS
jgi:putative transposase